MKKVLITGGHVTPAVAVANVLDKRGWEIVYVGRKHALEGQSVLSQEYRSVRKLGFIFIPIVTGRLQRTFTRYTLLSLLKIPIGCVQAFLFLIKDRPQVILSFGGYVAVPVVLTGWLLKIPLVIHEQTLSPGLANRLTARFATKICIAWEETKLYFPVSKTEYTGNPLRKEIFKVEQKLPLTIDKPLIYITGGNLGAQSMNSIVEQILDKLLNDFVVIHQCGSIDYSHFKKVQQKLSEKLQKRYFSSAYIESQYLGWALKTADVLLSRAGANTISEIIALGKPTIFVPLPWSGSGEQQKNAAYLVAQNAAVMIDQSELTGERLLQEIKKTFAQRNVYIQNLKKMQAHFFWDGDKKVADVVESIA